MQSFIRPPPPSGPFLHPNAAAGPVITQGPLITHYQDNTIYEEEEPLMSKMGFVLDKLMGAHYGDRNFDVFDWIPLIAILIAGGLIAGGLFPNGINTFGLNNGNLVLNGRRTDRKDDEEDSLEYALDQLESGVMMVSAMTREDGCSARLACRLGEMAKEKFDAGERADFIMGAVNAVLPQRFKHFSRSFEGVLRETDTSSCSMECYRCISLP